MMMKLEAELDLKAIEFGATLSELVVRFSAIWRFQIELNRTESNKTD